MNEQLEFIKDKIKNPEFMGFLSKKHIDVSALRQYNFNHEFKPNSVKSDFFILNEKFKEFELERFKKKR